jgi:hypothetical protein
MLSQHLSRVALTGLLVLQATAALHAQTATAEINGTIIDKSGGMVTGATIKLTNIGTRVTDQTQTNSKGYYVFINLQPAAYLLSVEATGFKTASFPAFQLTVNQTLTQNVTMDIGAVNETVTVTAEAPLLQQSSSNLGTVISEQAVKELPLNGRNFTQLMILTPGANPISTAQGSTGVGFQDAGVSAIPNTQFFKPSLHGQQNRSVLYYLDGIINTDFRGSIYGFLPIIDTVQEQGLLQRCPLWSECSRDHAGFARSLSSERVWRRSRWSDFQEQDLLLCRL